MQNRAGPGAILGPVLHRCMVIPTHSRQWVDEHPERHAEGIRQVMLARRSIPNQKAKKITYLDASAGGPQDGVAR